MLATRWHHDGQARSKYAITSLITELYDSARRYRHDDVSITPAVQACVFRVLPAERSNLAARARLNKIDGFTNTLYFDGHVAAVSSRSPGAQGFEVIYGITGTVNPDYSGLTDLQVQQLESLRWE